jgi:hypothetical protein
VAILFFSQFFRDNDPKLFEGRMQSARFCHALANLLDKLTPAERSTLGNIGNEADISSHSVRKGSATYCSSFIGGPSWISLFLRAGWSLGNVQDRYLKHSEGNDQFAGRLLSGSPYYITSGNTYHFAQLPPHFDDSIKEELLPLWGLILSNNYNILPASFKQTLPYLLASVVYHLPSIQATFGSDHKFFKRLLFTSRFITKQDLPKLVLTGSYYCPKTHMQCSGLPTQYTVVKAVVDEIKAMEVEIDEIRERISRLPTDLTNAVLDKVVVQGARPISQSDLNALEERIVDRLSAKPANPKPINNVDLDRNADPLGSDYYDDDVKTRFDLYPCSYKQRLLLVPENWVPPSELTCKALWFLWHHGDQNKRIGPYKRIDVAEDIKEKVNKNRFVKMQGIMKYLSAQVDNGISVSKLSVVESGAIFDKVYDDFLEKLIDAKIVQRDVLARSKNQWHSSTVYEHLRQYLLCIGGHPCKKSKKRTHASI